MIFSNKKVKYSKLLSLTSTFFILLIFCLGIGNFSNKIWINIFPKIISSELYFMDLNSFVIQLVCNSGNFSKVFYLNNYEYFRNCPYDTGYGPLSRLIQINSSSTILTLIICILIMLIYLNLILNFIFRKKQDYLLLTNLLFLSSPGLLALNRLNIDVIILPIIYFVIKYEKKYISNFIILLLSFLKIYPIFFFVYKFIRNFKFNNFLPIIYFLTTLFGIYKANEVLPRDQSLSNFFPNNYSLSFGVLSDLNYFLFNIQKIIGFLNSILPNSITTFIDNNRMYLYWIIFHFLVLILLIVLFRLNKLTISTDKISKPYELEIILSTSIFFILFSQFSNYDYRLIFLYPLIFIFYKYKIKNLYFLTIIFISTSSLELPELLHNGSSIIYLVNFVSFLFLYTVFLKYIISNLFKSVRS